MPAIGWTGGKLSENTPIGQVVKLALTSQKVGTITHTYDPIANGPLRYPMGLLHDLSLVTNPGGLPDMEAPDRTVCVVGWGRYEDLLAGNPGFLGTLNLTTGNTVKRCGVTRKGQRALYEGAQYIWDKECLMESVSVLWRTKHDLDPSVGFSGAVLCLGQPEDKTCLAVGFRNFETYLISRELVTYEPCRPSDKSFGVRIKGGCLLPEEIRKSEILCSPSTKLPAIGTFPSRSDPKDGPRNDSSPLRSAPISDVSDHGPCYC